MDRPAEEHNPRFTLLTASDRPAAEGAGSGRAGCEPISPCASIPERFRQSVALNPQAVAAVQGERVWSYAELDARSDSVAARLLEQGPEVGVVGLVAGRGLETLAALVGILKAGGAYLPFDPSYPESLLRQIHADSQPRRMIVDSALCARFGLTPFWAGPALELAGIMDGSLDRPERLPALGPDDPAYVMFTSGSTGRPKGVVIPQRGVLRLVVEPDYCRLSPGLCMLHLAPLAFDASTFEIWGALLNAGRLVIEAEANVGLDRIARLIGDQGIDTALLTTGLFHLLVDHQLEALAPVRQLLTGGDVLSPEHARRFLDAHPENRLVNAYGPTENSVCSCCYPLPADHPGDQPVPIGPAIRGTRAYVVDEHLVAVAPGESGELCVAGSGLALGYLGRPELTAERFLAAPQLGESLIYRTGDRVRQRSDGVFEFLGRADRQIKLNGKRIELDAIEAELRRLPQVTYAAVAAVPGQGGSKRLLAWVAPSAAEKERSGLGERIRQALSQVLPDFMLPSRIEVLDALPLTASGKVDRRQLLERVPAFQAQTPLAPSAADAGLVARLSALWARVLGLDSVGPQQAFFDLGGTSLQLLKLHALLKSELGLEVALMDLLRNPSVASLAAAIGGPDRAPKPAERRHGSGRGAQAGGPVAIIGLSGRWPGAANAERFWQNLIDGVESISRFSDTELEDGFDAATRSAEHFVAARSVLDDVEYFDAGFFGMQTREAERTDPQHRVFLECAWEALEDAGYDPARYPGAIGVFGGASIGTYLLRHLLGDRASALALTDQYQSGEFATVLGNLADALATRVAYKLDLKGPAVSVQSACSTSLLAVAQACQSLQSGQADMALAGGVSISFPQRRGYLYQEGGMLSADGRCRSFDSEASGTVFGSGAGVVVLKRLEDALADRDSIYAVIRGVGVNNDGAAKLGFAAPSAAGQARAIAMALDTAGVDARSIGYVECHGTATPLGDPIEISGLTQAFSAQTADRQFCAIGSVKTNVGHLDAAAGVTGLIKTALVLKHRQIPASLHYRSPNPRIDFPSTPFFVNDRQTPWEANGQPRRAGVSSFGVGGTNVHLVLEEAPAPAVSEPARSEPAGPQLVLVSARSPEALEQARERLAQHLERAPATALGDLAHTLQLGRRAFPHRLALVCSTTGEALAALRQSKAKTFPAREAPPPVAFLFPGQGSQYPGMGQDLYLHEPVFRAALDECSALVEESLGGPLTDWLYPAGTPADSDPDGQRQAQERLMATAIAQPAIFAVEYALARLWMARGIQPAMMIGHSVGEFVAATLAGVMSLSDALQLVTLRGRLMQALPPGAMLAVRLPEAEIAGLLKRPEYRSLSLAALNAPSLSVISGPSSAIEAFEAEFGAREGLCRRLQTSHAFHSAMVDPVIEPLRERAASMALSAAQIPCLSCVSGDWLSPGQARSPDYWARHAREPVRFAAGLSRLLAENPRPLLLEVGPGQVLATLARQIERGVVVAGSLPDPGRSVDDREVMLEGLGRLWAQGASPDWAALHPSGAARISLPGYPFERQRYFVDFNHAPASGPQSVAVRGESTSTSGTPLSVNPQAVASPTESHRNRLRSVVAAILEDLSGEPIDPAAGAASFLELGFDSLMLSQVAQKLQAQLKVKVTFRQLLNDLPSIDALTGYLVGQVAPLPEPAAAPAQPAPAPSLPQTTPVGMAAVSAVPQPAVVSGSTVGGSIVVGAAAAGGVTELFREQVAALSQLMNRQLDTLNGLGRGFGEPQPAALAPLAPLAALPPAVATSAPAAESPPPPSDEPEAPSRFQVYRPVQKSAESGLDPQQAAYVAGLAERYTRLSGGSKRFTAEFRAVLADPRAASGFRSEWKELVYPIVCERSLGSRIWDIDGNAYVDLVNGFGQTAFGHSPPFVTEAVKAQLERGFAIGPQSDFSGKVAALFSELTGNERVTFCNTGSEAVMAAMRIARCVTGRDKIVIFNGDYHGQFDEVLVKGLGKPGRNLRSAPVASGIPHSAVENMVVLEYGAPESLEWIRTHADELAAVIVEPVQSRHPEHRPFEFLRSVRSITEASGTAFVMDEVVTGFRVHPGGIQALTGIRADLATYGKVVGGGLPVGILAGKASFMDALDGGPWRYGDDSFPETAVTFFAGTFVRHPLVMAAVWAVLQHVRDQGPALQENLAQRTTGLVDRLQGLFDQAGLKARINHYSSWFYFSLHEAPPLAALLFHELRLRGVHILDGFPCFLTTEHSDADLEHIVAAFRDGLAELSGAGILSPDREAQPATLPQAKALAQEVPLTESQLEIWMSAQLGDEASCAFNESATLSFSGPLDEPALRAALDRVIARHDALRARFSASGETLRIAAAEPLPCPVSDWSDLAPEEAEARFSAWLAEDARSAFDLVSGPAIRARLVRLGTERSALVITAHHIVCDGWSMNVIVEELSALYRERVAGVPAQLSPALAFSTYAQREAQRPAQALEGTRKFWKAQFQTLPARLELPTDRPRPTLKSSAGASLCRHIDAELYRAVKKAGSRQGSTLFATLLAAFEVLIGRLAGANEVVVGVPTAGQSLLEDETLVGHCVNFLPVRAAWTPATRVSEHLKTVSRQVLDVFEHQAYTLGTLVRDLALPREVNRLPLTEVQFNLERLAESIEWPGGLRVKVQPNPKAYVNFDLFLNVIESSEGLRLDCDYNTDLFDPATIERWLDAYQALLRGFTEDPEKPLLGLALMSEETRSWMVDGLNASEAEYPREQRIEALFEDQARRQPQAVAARFEDQALSYAELDARANRFAHHLLQRLGPSGAAAQAASEAPVAISLERSLELLVALLGTLKAGLAYLPLDPRHPPARRRQILADAGVRALISSETEPTASLDAGLLVIDPLAEASAIQRCPEQRPDHTASATGLAYRIYTSGSTGVPKGVDISQRSVVNLLCSMAREPGIQPGDRMLALTTVAFDIAALELFLPLISGASVQIVSATETVDGFALLDRLESSGATHIQATPATWRLLLEAGFRSRPGLSMLCGGEALPRELADRLLEGGGALWNVYGPTETTIWSACGQVLAGEGPVSIGRPVANTRLLVLDAQDQLSPIGVPGQLHIGGDGLALGYHRRPELNAEKFIPNPHGPGRLYRTGDLAQRLADGRLLVLGRMDQQVKLRGFRIELGEIESVLIRHAGLAACAVLLRSDSPDNPRLTAYWVDREGQPQSAERLRDLALEHLPGYMVPSAWMRLDSLPLNPNGKLDRAALPAPEASAPIRQERIAPASDDERRLASIWAEVLQLESVGRNEDLFALGADSVHVFQITARAQRAGLFVSAKQLLQLRTIEAVAGALEHLKASAEAPAASQSSARNLSLQTFRRQKVTPVEEAEL